MSDIDLIEIGVDAKHAGELTRILLAAADHPSQVVKRTRPLRYIVPVAVARKAGIDVPDDEPDEIPVADEQVSEGTGEPNTGIEVVGPGPHELVGDGSGQALPPVENPDGTTELTEGDALVPASGGVINVPADAELPTVEQHDHAAGPDAPEPIVEDQPLSPAEQLVEESKKVPPVEGRPESDWKRADLEDYATGVLGFTDASPDEFSNREKLLAAINEEIARREAAAAAE